MDLEGSLDLLWRHAFTAEAHTINACDLTRWLKTAILVHYLKGRLLMEQHPFGESCILLHLLLRIPEPLVDLVDLQVELVGELQDFFPCRRLSIEILVQLPQGILLAL